MDMFIKHMIWDEHIKFTHENIISRSCETYTILWIEIVIVDDGNSEMRLNGI